MSNHKSEPAKPTTDGRQFYGDNNINMAQPARVGQFQPPSGGEFIDSAIRPTWLSPRRLHTDICLEDRQRNGRCINCDD
jgi:hypothetical protein